MTVVEVLNGMLDLLNAPERWIRGESARTADGHSVDLESDQAAAWCLAGAMSQVTEGYTINPQWRGSEYNRTREFLTMRCIKEYGKATIPDVNDHVLVDYEDMRLFLKRALLEAEELNI